MSVATGFIGVLVLFILLALRVPVALALIAVPVGGIAWLLGWTPAIGLLSSTPFSFVANWTLSAVPMFLLMGFIAFHTGMTGGLFDAAKAILRRIPGALAISSIFACSGFAAVCGSSLATAAAMGRIAIPEMVKSGYSPSFATGSIAAGGTIGALIPPSILMIVYGVFAETSVIKVFVGGVSIGLLTALAYTVVVLLTCWLRPDIAPPRPLDAGEIDTKKAVLEIWPVLLLMAIVFGGLFSGVFTATEAGAVGAMGALVLAFLKRRLTWASLWQALTETGHVTAAICFLLISAHVYARMIAMTGIPNVMESYIVGSGLGLAELIVIYLVTLIILGTILDAGSIMLITVPLAVPALASFNVDLIWFGILTIIAVEIGLLTPPLGLACFVIHNNLQDDRISVEDIFWGAAPFALTMVIVLVLVTLVPQIATLLL